MSIVNEVEFMDRFGLLWRLLGSSGVAWRVPLAALCSWLQDVDACPGYGVERAIT